MTYFIYVIFAHPDVYIGYTKSIKRRMKEHGNPPFWAVLETVDGVFVRDAEMKWVQKFSELGAGLLNINKDYSNGALRLSDEARKKLSEMNKGVRKNWNDEIRKRVAVTQFKPGQKPSEENLQAVSKTQKARWVEYRQTYRQTMTHCRSGHEYTSENTYEESGYHRCKTCRRENQKARRVARRTQKSLSKS